jgi:hypothetical protein
MLQTEFLEIAYTFSDWQMDFFDNFYFFSKISLKAILKEVSFFYTIFDIWAIQLFNFHNYQPEIISIRIPYFQPL